MSQVQSLEYYCNEINHMDVSSRIRAIEMILHSLNNPVIDSGSTPRKRGRLSELEGIGRGTWDGIDVDKFIREERDAWDSFSCVPSRSSS